MIKHGRKYAITAVSFGGYFLFGVGFTVLAWKSGATFGEYSAAMSPVIAGFAASSSVALGAFGAADWGKGAAGASRQGLQDDSK